MRSRSASAAAFGRDEIACGAALVLTIVGILVSVIAVGWTIWTTVVAGAIAVAVAALAAAVLLRHRLPIRRPMAVPVAVFVILALVCVGTAVATWARVATSQGGDDEDRQVVAERAAKICELLTTVTPATRDDNLVQLRPLIVAGMAELVKAEVLDHIPPNATTKGTVRAAGIRKLTDVSAQVIVVVDQTPAPVGDVNSDGQRDDRPSALILELAFIRDDGQWKMETIAPATT
jgi:hypothetical protein